MSVFSQEKNALLYSFDGEELRVEAWGENSFRVRSVKSCDVPDEDWALTMPVKETEVSISIEEKNAEIVNGKIKAVITHTGKITFFNQKGEILLDEHMRNRKDIKSDYFSSLSIQPREFRPLLGGDYELTVRFNSTARDEKIYGMGQYQQDILNLKGCQLELAHRNSQSSVPFYISNKGYGFLWNNPAVGEVVFGLNVMSWHARSTKKMDYWITAGDTPAEIETAYASVTGTVPMMPDYAMGFWQCKLRYQTQDEVLRVAREYKKRGLPLSVIVIDFFHWDVQGNWKFDPTFWPDPDAMVKELNDMGVEVMVSIWPTVDYASENFGEMRQKGYLVRTDRGIRITMDFQGQTVFYDPTNPKAREYVWGKAKQNYFDKGIRTFWLDEAEPEYSVYDFDNYRYYKGPNVQVGNIYPVMYSKTFYDGLAQEGEEKIINLVRCAWAGSQKYGSLIWSGDIHSTFRSFRNQLAAGLSMAIAGIPWWTTDIGGFFGGDPTDEGFQELLARWFEWGTFCPVMRLHGDRVPKQPRVGTTGGSGCRSGADNEVWSFGDRDYDICKKYLQYREDMKPYITELMEKAHLDGTPVMRPLFYDFSDDKESWEVEDEYMFGPKLLVAPVMYAGAVTREVYLPQGASWENVWTHETFEGGQRITADAPIDIIPLFKRV